MEAACCQGHAGLHYVSLLWLGSVAVYFCVVGPLDSHQQDCGKLEAKGICPPKNK